MKCNICQKEKKHMSLEPTRSQLIFGGFPIKMEYRCQQCENKIVKQLDKLCGKDNANLLEYPK